MLENEPWREFSEPWAKNAKESIIQNLEIFVNFTYVCEIRVVVVADAAESSVQICTFLIYIS